MMLVDSNFDLSVFEGEELVCLEGTDHECAIRVGEFRPDRTGSSSRHVAITSKSRDWGEH